MIKNPPNNFVDSCYVVATLSNYFDWHHIAVESMRLWMSELYDDRSLGLLILARPTLDAAVFTGKLVTAMWDYEFVDLFCAGWEQPIPSIESEV